MYLFYSQLINIPILILSESDSKHCINVLRLKINDTIYIANGEGKLCKAVIINLHPKKCEVKIVEEINDYKKSNYYLHIVIAPTKNIDRYEWFIEKAIEIGVNEITPIICNRSERKVVKQDRTEKIAIAAMKQSLRAYLPKINEAINFNEFIKKPFDGKKFIAHCADKEKKLLKDSIKKKENALILIGPEGDFSENEIRMAIDNKFQAISLGENRLRTETAGIVACITVSFTNQ